MLADVGEFAVAENLGRWVAELQGLEQIPKGGLLFACAGVGFLAFGVDAAFVADAYGVLVVVAGMGADKVLMTGLDDLAITGDVIVVAGETEAPGVVAYELLNGVAPVFARGAAVDDNEIYFAHSLNDK